MPVERQALIRFGTRKVQASFPPVAGLPPAATRSLSIRDLTHEQGLRLRQAMWLGTGDAIVDDTTVTFVAGCVSAAGV
jgi:hypothetical protein